LTSEPVVAVGLLLDDDEPPRSFTRFCRNETSVGPEPELLEPADGSSASTRFWKSDCSLDSALLESDDVLLDVPVVLALVPVVALALVLALALDVAAALFPVVEVDAELELAEVPVSWLIRPSSFLTRLLSLPPPYASSMR
jgi:hypothetical protein